MVKWLDILEKALSSWKDLVLTCGCSDEEAERELAQLPRDLPLSPEELGKCCACILREVLESMYVLQVPLSSPTSDTMIYILEDALVEVSEDCGYVVSLSAANRLVDILKELGYDTRLLEDLIKNVSNR